MEHFSITSHQGRKGPRWLVKDQLTGQLVADCATEQEAAAKAARLSAAATPPATTPAPTLPSVDRWGNIDEGQE